MNSKSDKKEKTNTKKITDHLINELDEKLSTLSKLIHEKFEQFGGPANLRLASRMPDQFDYLEDIINFFPEEFGEEAEQVAQTFLNHVYQAFETEIENGNLDPDIDGYLSPAVIKSNHFLRDGFDYLEEQIDDGQRHRNRQQKLDEIRAKSFAFCESLTEFITLESSKEDHRAVLGLWAPRFPPPGGVEMAQSFIAQTLQACVDGGLDPDNNKSTIHRLAYRSLFASKDPGLSYDDQQAYLADYWKTVERIGKLEREKDARLEQISGRSTPSIDDETSEQVKKMADELDQGVELEFTVNPAFVDRLQFEPEFAMTHIGVTNNEYFTVEQVVKILCNKILGEIEAEQRTIVKGQESDVSNPHIVHLDPMLKKNSVEIACGVDANLKEVEQTNELLSKLGEIRFLDSDNQEQPAISVDGYCGFHITTAVGRESKDALADLKAVVKQSITHELEDSGAISDPRRHGLNEYAHPISNYWAVSLDRDIQRGIHSVIHQAVDGANTFEELEETIGGSKYVNFNIKAYHQQTTDENGEEIKSDRIFVTERRNPPASHDHERIKHIREIDRLRISAVKVGVDPRAVIADLLKQAKLDTHRDTDFHQGVLSTDFNQTVYHGPAIAMMPLIPYGAMVSENKALTGQGPENTHRLPNYIPQRPNTYSKGYYDPSKNDTNRDKMTKENRVYQEATWNTAHQGAYFYGEDGTPFGSCLRGRIGIAGQDGCFLSRQHETTWPQFRP